MRFSKLRNLAPARPRHARRLPLAAAEALEARSLLSSAAVIRWEMTPRFAPDPARGNQPDLPNTRAYANPAGGFEVRLDASESSGIGPATTFSWIVTDARGHRTRLGGEDPTVNLPQGTYTVRLRANGLIGADGPSIATSTVKVKDVLVVSIGDSYASGEGNPVVPGLFGVVPPQWAYSPDSSIDQENANAHRSTVAGPAQFALGLERSDPHQSVTFVSVANSGASISQGLLGPMQSIGDPSARLPAEIAELKRIIGKRTIDVLTISVGGNDVGFVSQLENLVENTAVGSPARAAIRARFDADLATLPGKYAALGKAIQGLDPGRVLITGYPDLTRDERGDVAAIPGPFGTTLISQANARFASRRIIAPLNQAIAGAASANGWTFTGIAAAFSTHGYPSTDPWIRLLEESLQIQGNVDGTFHPNAEGHQAIARRLLATYRGARR